MTEVKPQKDIDQSVSSVKDIIKDKIGKLAAAVYLVTNFLDDMDQIKWKLRAKALDLKANLTNSNEATLSLIEEIISLTDIAVLDRRASMMNFSILRDGYSNLQTEFQKYLNLNADWYKRALLPASPSLGGPNQTNQQSSQIDSPKITPKISHNPPKTDTGRRDKILDFIKQNNWSSIRDIAKFIPGVSSKTVQRELAELVRIGTLKKTGERRWSRYSAEG